MSGRYESREWKHANLPDLVREEYDEREIAKIQSSKGRKFRITCPICGGKHLSVLSNMKVGICFRDEVFFSVQLEEMTYDYELNSYIFMDRNFEPPNLMFYRFYKDLSECKDHLAYLKQRNPYVKDWSVFGIRGQFRKIIIPFYFLGSMIFYQTRSIDEKVYKFPFSDEKPLYICGSWNFSQPLIIAEGAFDAIAYKTVFPEYNVVGVGGKILTEFQSKMLSELGYDGVFIGLDKFDLSLKLKYSFRGLTRILPFFGEEDPEEILRRQGPDGLISLMAKARKYDYKMERRVHGKDDLYKSVSTDLGSITFK